MSRFQQRGYARQFGREAYFTDVVYRYEYERAVREGYLVDYDPVAIKSNVRMTGAFLHEGADVKRGQVRFL